MVVGQSTLMVALQVYSSSDQYVPTGLVNRVIKFQCQCLITVINNIRQGFGTVEEVRRGSKIGSFSLGLERFF